MRGLWLLLALAACGPAASPNLRGLLSREQIDALPGPVLYAEIESLEASAILQPAGDNDGATTWATVDGVSLAMNGPLLVATRGLGFDLMQVDGRGTLSALAGGRRDDYPRIHAYLDGENRTLFRAFRCVMTEGRPETIRSFGLERRTLRHEETCYSTGAPVVNVFWIGADGTPWRTLQWVGPDVGPILTETLTR